MENESNFAVSAKALNALAIIGFVALVGGGISLAVFGARFVPNAVSGLSSAAVSLSSIFVSKDTGETATTTDNGVDTATTTPAVATTTPVVATSTPIVPVTPTPGQKTGNIYQVPGTGTPVLSGLPDLVTTITATGYYSPASPATLIATTSIPSTISHVVVRFKIQNKGTNIVTNGWSFNVSLPAGSRAFDGQQALLPGERIEYELSFDRPTTGTTPTISVVADGNNYISESAEDNNTASTTLSMIQ